MLLLAYSGQIPLMIAFAPSPAWGAWIVAADSIAASYAMRVCRILKPVDMVMHVNAVSFPWSQRTQEWPSPAAPFAGR
jgi:hypothetical protein